MIAVRDKLVNAGVTHYYKRRTLGSGFIRFTSGKIYYLPRYITTTFSRLVTLSYLIQKDGGIITSASKAFTDEPSFRSSLRFLYRVVTNAHNPVLEFRASKKNRSFTIESTKEILTGFDSSGEMLDWIGKQTNLDEIFTTEEQNKIINLEEEHATILEKVVAEEVSRVTESLVEGVLDRYKRTESILKEINNHACQLPLPKGRGFH